MRSSPTISFRGLEISATLLKTLTNLGSQDCHPENIHKAETPNLFLFLFPSVFLPSEKVSRILQSSNCSNKQNAQIYLLFPTLSLCNQAFVGTSNVSRLKNTLEQNKRERERERPEGRIQVGSVAMNNTRFRFVAT